MEKRYMQRFQLNGQIIKTWMTEDQHNSLQDDLIKPFIYKTLSTLMSSKRFALYDLRGLELAKSDVDTKIFGKYYFWLEEEYCQAMVSDQQYIRLETDEIFERMMVMKIKNFATELSIWYDLSMIDLEKTFVNEVLTISQQLATTDTVFQIASNEDDVVNISELKSETSVLIPKTENDTDEYDGTDLFKFPRSPEEISMKNIKNSNYICGVCMVMNNNYVSARRHMDEHNPLQCLWCTKIVKDETEIKEHYVMHSRLSSKFPDRINCPYCHTMCLSLESANAHLEIYHSKKVNELGYPENR